MINHNKTAHVLRPSLCQRLRRARQAAGLLVLSLPKGPSLRIKLRRARQDERKPPLVVSLSNHSSGSKKIQNYKIMKVVRPEGGLRPIRGVPSIRTKVLLRANGVINSVRGECRALRGVSNQSLYSALRASIGTNGKLYLLLAVGYMTKKEYDVRF